MDFNEAKNDAKAAISFKVTTHENLERLLWGQREAGNYIRPERRKMAKKKVTIFYI